jgi:Transposase zinc-binding domain
VARKGLEVADVFRHFGPAFRNQHGGSLSSAQRHAMTAIESCRTAALGGHVERCGDCGHQRVSFNSCRNRNCPKCQGLARAQWLEDRQAELLDVPYFHVVFTVPSQIEVIAFQNQTVVYDIMFRAASETLRIIAADPEHLNRVQFGNRSPLLRPGGADQRLLSSAAADRTRGFKLDAV